MQEQLWPSREESAATNLRRAISETQGDFVVEWIERGENGYFVLFRRGSVVHRELGIEISVLEGGPHRDEIRELVQRVKSVFDRR
jgi:hypothetical protein